MRICFVSHSAGQYGSELALLELLQGLIKLGASCLVLVPKKGPLLIELDRLYIEWRIIRYPYWLSRPRWASYRLARTMISLVRSVWVVRTIAQWHCDVVYTNTSSISVGALAAWLVRKPHVWHLHESGWHIGLEYDLGERWTARLVDRFSALIIVVSRSLKNHYSRYIKPDKMHLIYQSVTLRSEIEKTHNLNRDKQFLQCVIVASLQRYKGQEEAISALSEVIRRGINVHLLVVGDGKKCFQVSLRQQVADHGLEKHVEFVGYVENPMLYIRGADIVLVCSYCESFGRVTVEAMLAGRPVIGTASGGTAELIQDRVTGLLYNPGNHGELADKIQYLYENPEERLRLGAAARIWAADRFTQERYAKEVFYLLSGVLKRKGLSA